MGRAWALFGASWAIHGALFGHFWGILAASLGRPGLGHLRLGLNLAPREDSLGRPWCVLWASLGVLAAPLRRPRLGPPTLGLDLAKLG